MQTHPSNQTSPVLFRHGIFGAEVGDGGKVGVVTGGVVGALVGAFVGGRGALVGALVGAIVGACVHCAPKFGQTPEKGSHV